MALKGTEWGKGGVWVQVDGREYTEIRKNSAQGMKDKDTPSPHISELF